MEHQTRDKGRPFIHRGEIKAIKIKGRGGPARAMLEIQFVWLAKGEGFPSAVKRWIRITPTTYREYVVDLTVFEASDSHIALKPLLGSERLVLRSKKGDLLDPSEVQGL